MMEKKISWKKEKYNIVDKMENVWIFLFIWFCLCLCTCVRVYEGKKACFSILFAICSFFANLYLLEDVDVTLASYCWPKGYIIHVFVSSRIFVFHAILSV